MNGEFCAGPSVTGMASRLLADIDCQAFGLVERGYAALSQPDGTAAAALTGLLVLAVAFFGYRLLLGRGLALSEVITLAIRMGIVLMLAGSWAGFHSIAYDLFARAPTQIAGELLSGIGGRKPLAALDYTLNSLDAVGAGYRLRGGASSPFAGGSAAAAMTLYLSAQILTLSTVGLLLVGRLVLALLLAVTPIMAGFLLFDATRGMVEGWLRAMITAALTPLFVLVFASIELSVLLPLIGRVFAEQAAGRFDIAVTTPIGLVTTAFGLAMLTGVTAGARIANGIRLPRKAVPQPAAAAPVQAPMSAPVFMQPPAARVAQALEGMARREPVAAGAGTHQLVERLMRDAGRPVASTTTNTTTVSGSPSVMYARIPASRTSPRRSRTAMRRDR